MSTSNILKIDFLTVQGDSLVFSQGCCLDSVSLQTILFVLTSAPRGDYTVCCLKEDDPEKTEATFELLLLRCTAVPDQVLRSHQLLRLPDHLSQTHHHNQHAQQDDDQPNIHHRHLDIIVSTNAGTGRALEFWETVLQPLLKLTYEEETSVSPSSGGHTAVSATITAKDNSNSSKQNVLITQSADCVPRFASCLHKEYENLSGETTTTMSSRTLILLSGDGAVVDLLNGYLSSSSSSSSTTTTTTNSITPYPPLTISLIPLGTGNALFHSLHKPLYHNHNHHYHSIPNSNSSTTPLATCSPSPLVLSLRTLFLGTPAPLPVFQATFSAGSHTITPGVDPASSLSSSTQTHTPRTAIAQINGAIVASYGFHASVVYESDTPAYRLHGRARFGMVAQSLLQEAHPYTAQVYLHRCRRDSLSRGDEQDKENEKEQEDGWWEEVPRRKHAYVLATMVSNLESTFEISPASKPLDGKLRVVHFGNVGGEKTMEVMRRAYDGGSHVGMEWGNGEKVMYEEVDGIKIVTMEDDGRWRKVCIDGTIVEIPKGGHMIVKRLPTSPLHVVVNPAVLHD